MKLTEKMARKIGLKVMCLWSHVYIIAEKPNIIIYDSEAKAFVTYSNWIRFVDDWRGSIETDLGNCGFVYLTKKEYELLNLKDLYEDVIEDGDYEKFKHNKKERESVFDYGIKMFQKYLEDNVNN